MAVQLADISIARVRAAVLALLDIDSVENLVEVHIEPSGITAVFYAVDAAKLKFLIGNDVAKNEITRRIVP